MEKHIPVFMHDGYLKGFRYKDAVLDDARLVFRIIRETVQDGGTALNYAKAAKTSAQIKPGKCLRGCPARSCRIQTDKSN